MKNIQIHSSAIIDPGAKIGELSKIWHWSHISSGAKIGKKVNIGQNVFVSNKVVIGNNCKIQNNVSIFDGVTLEDGVFCGPSSVFTNVKYPRAFIEKKDQYLPTLVKQGVTLGANCTIICGITIGHYAFISAGSVVTKNVEPYALMTGCPARQVGWVSEYGEKIELPLKGNQSFICSKSNKKYTLTGDKLVVDSI